MIPSAFGEAARRGDAAVARRARRRRARAQRARQRRQLRETGARPLAFYEGGRGGAQRNPRRAAAGRGAAVRGLRERRRAERGRATSASRAGALVFARELRQEGRLGFWRWASILFGVAGTYRQNDVVDVVYEVGGRRTVASGLAGRAGASGRSPLSAARTALGAARAVSCPGSSRQSSCRSGSPGRFIRPSLPSPSTSCAGIMQSAGRDESASSISSHGSRRGSGPRSVSVSCVDV